MTSTLKFNRKCVLLPYDKAVNLHKQEKSENSREEEEEEEGEEIINDGEDAPADRREPPVTQRPLVSSDELQLEDKIKSSLPAKLHRQAYALLYSLPDATDVLDFVLYSQSRRFPEPENLRKYIYLMNEYDISFNLISNPDLRRLMSQSFLEQQEEEEEELQEEEEEEEDSLEKVTSRKQRAAAVPKKSSVNISNWIKLK